MKILSASMWLAISLLIISQAASAQAFKSEDDQFSIWFPAKPTVADVDMGGGAAAKKYTANPVNGTIIASVLTGNLPSPADTDAAKSGRYDKVAESLRASTGSKIVSSKDMQISGAFGREVKMSKTVKVGTIITTVRVVIFGTRFYQMDVIGFLEHPDAVKTKKFFDSFKYLGVAEIVERSSAPESPAGPAAAQLEKGRKYFDQKDYTPAIKALTEAIRLDPKLEAAYFYRASSYLESGQYPAAIADYSKAVTLSKTDEILAENLYNRALAYDKSKNAALAMADCNKAISLKQDYWQAIFHRGNLYYNSGKTTLALNDYTETIRLQPEYVQAYEYRADCYDKLGKTALAQQDREKAKSLQK